MAKEVIVTRILVNSERESGKGTITTRCNALAAKDKIWECIFEEAISVAKISEIIEDVFQLKEAEIDVIYFDYKGARLFVCKSAVMKGEKISGELVLRSIAEQII